MCWSEVHSQMEQLGSNGPSFNTNIFTIGPFEKREMRETTSKRLLREGVSLSFDFGCVLEGYCSDFGRTVHIGEPSSEFRKAYAAVIGAHDAAIKEMKSGQITAERTNAIARAVIDEAGFGEHFRHRLGHGIGLDVHEPAFLTEGDTTMLQTGMAFTVEPSIYWIGNIGVRIEDIVVVRPNGGQILERGIEYLGTLWRDQEGGRGEQERPTTAPFPVVSWQAVLNPQERKPHGGQPALSSRCRRAH